MEPKDSPLTNISLINKNGNANRRSFLKTLGIASAVGMAGLASSSKAMADDDDDNNDDWSKRDTPVEIFTAALIAEDLATTFYYEGLTGGVIQDVNLAGPGGSATKITASGSASNVGYIRAALSEEIDHANLFRSLLGISSPAEDPVQTFYFPWGTFGTLNPFITILEALENAFIGAYLTAIQEFGDLASRGRTLYIGDNKYKPKDLVYYAKVAGSILGVESEHRALGRAIVPTLIPANNYCYEQTDGLLTVYNGPHSAVAALGPFVTPSSSSQPFKLSAALAGAASVSLPCTGSPPAPTAY